MKYFVNVQSYEDLKTQYRALALENHPDAGGDTETMKAINNEYDSIFPMWKHRETVTTGKATAETAASTRSEFYTQHGWKGENYSSNISLKEIACIIREYVKDVHNDYKFSVTTEYFSMGRSLYIAIMEAPADVYTATVTERPGYVQSINYRVENEQFAPEFRAVIKDVQSVMDSYNRQDCDSMIDYFDVSFYDHLDLGKWDKPYKIVPRTKKAPTFTEYETVEVTKTRTKKAFEPRVIEAPATIQPGAMFQLKSNFNYGGRRGTVYQVDRMNGEYYIYAYKMGKGYKNKLTGNIAGNSFFISLENLRAQVEKGAIAFVELHEVTKTEEYTSTVRRPKKAVTAPATTDNAQDHTTAESPTASGAGDKAYTITKDTDTRDGSAIWVVRFADRMERDEYKKTAAQLKEIGGYYSEFKKGFIFRTDPASELINLYGDIDALLDNLDLGYMRERPQGSEQSTETDTFLKAAGEIYEESCAGIDTAERSEDEQVADDITDASTVIIEVLQLKPYEYITNLEYREQLTAYITGIKDRITPDAVKLIEIDALRFIVETILEEIKGEA